MKFKSETSNLLKYFISYDQTQFQTCVKILRSNNGSKFTLKKTYMTHRIHYQISCIDTPQHNDIVERKHQYLLGITRALFFQSHLPKHFLGPCHFYNH